MSGRRAAWICAELTADAQRRLQAAGCEADREVLHRAFWPLAKRLAKGQKNLQQAEFRYEFTLAAVTRAAMAATAAIDAVAVPREVQLAALDALVTRDERTPNVEEKGG